MVFFWARQAFLNAIFENLGCRHVMEVKAGGAGFNV